MFIQSKEENKYSFSIELSSKEINEQVFSEAISFFDRTSYKEKNVKEIEYSTNIDIPAKVFREGNNGLRAIVKFLKEEKNLSFSKISRILGRDQRTIWCAYNSTIKKDSGKKDEKNKKDKTKEKAKEKNNYDDEPKINSSVFADRRLSVLENAAMHLLKNYSVKETAEILGRNQMTIWTVKRRAENKLKIEEKTRKEKKGDSNEQR